MKVGKPINEVVGHIGEKIRELRKAKGLNQDALAQALDMSRVAIHNIEKGKHRTTVENLFSLCILLGCTPNDLFPPTSDYTSTVEEKTIFVPKVKKVVTMKKIEP